MYSWFIYIFLFSNLANPARSKEIFVIYLLLLLYLFSIGKVQMEEKNNNDTYKSKIVKYFLFYGTITNLAYKTMTLQKIQEGSHIKMFFHPYMISLSVLVANLMNLLIYWVKQKQLKIPLEKGKYPHTSSIFIIPSLAYMISTLMQFAALNMISGSTYLLIKGSSVITTVFFSKVVFGMSVQRQQIWGCGFSIVGLVIVGMSAMINQDSDSMTQPFEGLGITLMIISLIFNGFQYSYEQFLMTKHTIHPLELTGSQGLYGTTIMLIIAGILSFIPCEFDQNLCAFDSNGQAYMQRFDIFFIGLFNSWILVVSLFLGMISMGLYCYYGIAIIKYHDGITKALLNIVRTFIVWIIGLGITMAVGGDSIYQFQQTYLFIIGIKTVGYAFTIIGTLISKKIIFRKYFSIQQVMIEQSNINDSIEVSATCNKQIKISK